MTTEKDKAYEAWWFHSIGPLHRETIGIKESFHVGWEAALANRPLVRETHELVGRAIEKECCRAEIMGRAYEAFRDGRDEAARLYRELATELFGKQEK